MSASSRSSAANSLGVYSHSMRVRLAQDARALLLGVRAAEVAQQPRANALRLADVEHLAVAREHPIDAGPVLRAGAHVAAQRRDVCFDAVACAERVSSLTADAEHGRAAVDRVRLDQTRPAPGQGSPPRPYTASRSTKPPASARGIAIIAEARAAGRDRFGEHIEDGGVQRAVSPALNERARRATDRPARARALRSRRCCRCLRRAADP